MSNGFGWLISVFSSCTGDVIGFTNILLSYLGSPKSILTSLASTFSTNDSFFSGILKLNILKNFPPWGAGVSSTGAGSSTIVSAVLTFSSGFNNSFKSATGACSDIISWASLWIFSTSIKPGFISLLFIIGLIFSVLVSTKFELFISIGFSSEIGLVIGCAFSSGFSSSYTSDSESLIIGSVGILKSLKMSLFISFSPFSSFISFCVPSLFSNNFAISSSVFLTVSLSLIIRFNIITWALSSNFNNDLACLSDILFSINASCTSSFKFNKRSLLAIVDCFLPNLDPNSSWFIYPISRIFL